MQYQKIQTVISFYSFWTENPAIILDNPGYGEIKRVFLNLSNINERAFCENSSLLNPNKAGIFEGSFFWGLEEKVHHEIIAKKKKPKLVTVSFFTNLVNFQIKINFTRHNFS